jgi:hypothetical protein
MPPASRTNPTASSTGLPPATRQNGYPADPGQRPADTGGFPTAGGRRAVESGYVAPVGFGPSGSVDRRSIESGYMAPVARGNQHAAGETGSRRHRADDRQPSGSHARPDPDAPGGSHATGRSVSELLASNGSGPDTPRRRRRRED